MQSSESSVSPLAYFSAVSRLISRVSPWLWAAVGVILVSLTAHFRSIAPLSFDEAYNFQVARSLAEHFSYSTTYAPGVILNPAITTNGVPQYLAAIVLAVTHNIDITAVIMSASAMALLVLGAYLLRPWLVGIVALLFFGWDAFFDVSINFVGEIWSIGFLLIGIVFLEKALKSPESTGDHAKRYFALAVLFFAFAIWAKLIALFAVIPLLLGMLAQNAHERGMRRYNKVAFAIGGCTVLGTLSVVAFFFLTTLSVLHSVRSLSDFLNIGNTISAFVGHHVSLGVSDRAGGDFGLLARLHQINPAVLLLLLFGLVALALSDLWYVTLALIVVIAWLVFDLDYRQLVPILVPAMIYGVGTFSSRLKRAGNKFMLDDSIVSLAMGLLIWFAFVLVSSISNVHFVGTAMERAIAAPSNYAISTSRGRYYYGRSLLDAINKEPIIVTSGWWQFPELSIRLQKHFYDRMNPANANLNRPALLFDEGIKNWPLTSAATNCGTILHKEGPLILCRYKDNTPLNLQAPEK